MVRHAAAVAESGCTTAEGEEEIFALRGLRFRRPAAQVLLLEELVYFVPSSPQFHVNMVPGRVDPVVDTVSHPVDAVPGGPDAVPDRMPGVPGAVAYVVSNLPHVATDLGCR